MLYRVHLARVAFEITILVAICTDCTGSCKSNYHTITPGPSSDYERTLWLFQKRVVHTKLKIYVLLHILYITNYYGKTQITQNNWEIII